MTNKYTLIDEAKVKFDWIASPQSSDIAKFAYVKKMNLLLVKFKSGSTYQFFDVPKGVYNGLLRAPSKGKYFAYNIKNNYHYQSNFQAESTPIKLSYSEFELINEAYIKNGDWENTTIIEGFNDRGNSISFSVYGHLNPNKCVLLARKRGITGPAKCVYRQYNVTTQEHGERTGFDIHV